tara:strand:- start:450 stop:662 length:213 start_codon:yes stop_codon:yes gene_type:complete
MAIAGLVLITALFFNDNAEFFAKAEEQYEKGAKWEWVGPQARDPMTPAIPFINEETGEETILYKLKMPKQ